MRPVLAIDVDGVLTDHRTKWIEHYRKKEKEHNHKPFDEAHDWAEQWDYFKTTCQECFRYCLTHPDVICGHVLYPDVLDILTKLSEFCDLHVVTKRPEEVENSTQVWLAWNQIHPLFKSINFTRDKNLVLQEIGADVLLDDSPEVLVHALETTKTLPVTYAAPYNATLGLQPVVRDWKEFLSLIQALYSLLLANPSQDFRKLYQENASSLRPLTPGLQP